MSAMPCWLAAFLLNLAVGLIAVGTFIVSDNGYFALSHDFNGQEIAFNMFMNDAVKSGNLLWNWGIDIGSNFLETFSFYNVGSVFFWISLLFPADSVPQVMGWIIILKYAVAGAVSACWFERHLNQKTVILTASLLYAFSGFQCGSIVFYHFQDQAALFPLLLIGLEELVEEKKHGRLLCACTINALCNFVFFVGEVIFLVIYYVVRYLYPVCAGKGAEKKKVKECLWAAASCMLEGAIGTAVSGILLVPSISGILANSRIANHIDANAYLTMSTRDWLGLIKAFFTPAEGMNSYSCVVTGDWMTNMAYLPMFGMTFVIAYLLSKKDWTASMLKICFFMAAVPILNSVFTSFSSGGYRRWYYMMIVFMALVTGKVLEEPKRYRIKAALFITLLIFVFYVWVLKAAKWNREGEYLIYYEKRFILLTAAALAGAVLSCLFVLIKPKYRMKAYIAGTMGFCVFTLAFVVYKYRMTPDNTGIDFHSYEASFSESVAAYLTEYPEGMEREVLPYRYYFDEGIGHTYYNIAMTNALPSINSFNSTVHPSITEFYDQLDIGRWTWSNGGYTGVRELLGARYIYSAMEHGEYLYVGEIENSNGQKLIQYENQNALPVGFTYDSYLTRSEFKHYEPTQKPIVMLRALIVEDEDEGEVSSCLRHFDSEEVGPEYLAEAVGAHRDECSEQFEQGDNYFAAVINGNREKFAFFSVPYDKSWKARVNGEEARIFNINGLMAVKIGEGRNEIRFDYVYAPIKLGILCTAVGALGAGIYLWAAGKRKGLSGMGRTGRRIGRR